MHKKTSSLTRKALQHCRAHNGGEQHQHTRNESRCTGFAHSAAAACRKVEIVKGQCRSGELSNKRLAKKIERRTRR